MRLIVAIWVIAFSFSGHAQTIAHWTGKGHDDLWTTPHNWDTHAVPGSNDTAIIDLPGSNVVILDTNLVIGNITLDGTQGTNVLQFLGGSIECSQTFLITNNGVLELRGNSSLGGGGMENFGHIKVPANLGTKFLTLNCRFNNHGTLAVETNSALTLPGSVSNTPTFWPGTIFDGGGALRFTNLANIDCTGTMTVNCTVELQAQPTRGITGPSTWTGPGLFRWYSGGISNLTFASDLHVETTGASQKTVIGTCTNQGTLRWLADTASLGASGANSKFYNVGLFQIENNCTLGPTNFQNTGTFRVPPNLGTVSLTLQCGFTNYGVIDVESNSLLLVQRPYSSPPASFESGTVFDGSGTVRFPTNSNFSINGNIVCNGTITVNGIVELNVGQTGGATWTGSGLLRWWGNPLFNPTFASSFHVEINNNDPKAFVGNCTNKGTARFIGGDFGFYGQVGNFYNEGLFQIESACNLVSGVTNFQNSGTVRILGTGSLVANPQPFFIGGLLNSGIFQIETNCAISGFGSFQNTGTIKVPTGLGELSMGMDCNFINYGVIDVATNSTLKVLLEPGNPTVTLESGTLFSGPGTIDFTSGAINCRGQITVDGVVEADSVQGSNVVWTGPGLLRFAIAAINNFTFAPDFHSEMIGPEPKVLIGACTNQGTMRILGTGNLVPTPLPSVTSEFYNSGVVQIETNFGFIGITLFQNTGTIRVPPDAGELTLSVDCNFTNFGTVDVESNSVLNFSLDTVSGSSATFESGSYFSGPGTVRTAGLSYDGIITANGIVEYSGDSFSESVLWTGPGMLRWYGGGFKTVTFAPNFHVEMDGISSKHLTAVCTNQGTIRWLNGHQLNDSMTTGRVYNAGLFQIENDGVWINTPICNQSNGVIRQLAGVITTQSLTNLGTMDLKGGFLFIDENFCSSSNSTYRFTMAGNNQGTDFNSLVAQNLTLDGSLQVNLTNGFLPSSGYSYPIAGGILRIGNFNSVMLPTLQSNLACRIRYTSDSALFDVGTPPVISNILFTNGQFQYSFSGFPGGSYEVQASTNLIDWTTVETNFFFSGSLNFIDTNAIDFDRRFYRLRIFE